MEKKDATYSAEDIEALLNSGTLTRLGIGSRRVCYRLPETGLCVKCYRSDEEIKEGKCPGDPHFEPLSATAIREIRHCRFDEKRNTGCQEYRYWMELKRRIPEELMAVFPSTIQPMELPTRGWCLVEECILNFDGSPATRFQDAWVGGRIAPRMELYDAFNKITDDLVQNAVKMYDIPNLLVQKMSNGTIRLRIADFEPVARTFIVLDRLSPVIVRMKLRRRFKRYRKMLRIDETLAKASKR